MNKGSKNFKQEKTHSINSPNVLEFSSYLNYSMRKRQKLQVTTNQSISSTRDHSLYRNLTPTFCAETFKPKANISPKNKEIDNIKKQLDCLFEFLPKIASKTNGQKVLRTEAIPFKKEKKLYNTVKVEGTYLPNRSKSTLTSNAKYFPNMRNENSHISEMNIYLIEFHNKSKFLLNQLEEKIFGKKSF
ncbi:hypothetical protein SteCoe_33704 [Stentor coeruleus]|uniref:Uncharacterized protein n=1 Tax=Stentor coeruleus TaxID=5963 RepID=A0A1R2AW51_9CILI|nr:hypothetical protein SteCoe_33704 [Stentor coeruleus]